MLAIALSNAQKQNKKNSHAALLSSRFSSSGNTNSHAQVDATSKATTTNAVSQSDVNESTSGDIADIPNDTNGNDAGSDGAAEDERLFLTAVELDGASGAALSEANEHIFLSPNAVHSVKDVREQVKRVFDTGYFSSVEPEVQQTRDGAKLVLSCSQNATLNGVVVEGAHALPEKAVHAAFDGQVLNTLNFHNVRTGIDALNQWYEQRGLFGQVSGVTVDERNCLLVTVSEVRVASVGVRAVDKDTGEPAPRRITRDDAILRHVGTHAGDVYSLKQGRQDIDSVYAMGVFDDVSIKPQLDTEDQSKVHLTLDVAERKPGGFSAGGGLSTKSMTEGPLAGFVGNCSYTHRNLFGLNQQLSASLEAGHVDSIFNVSHHDPWILHDKHQTSRTITVQSTRTSAASIHSSVPSGAEVANATTDGDGAGFNEDGGSPRGGPTAAGAPGIAESAANEQEQSDISQSGLNVRRRMASLEYSRPVGRSLRASLGVSAQQAGVRDESGNRRTADAYGSQVTHTGNFDDVMAVALAKAAYSSSVQPLSGSCSVEQAVPVVRPMLHFTRVQGKADMKSDFGALKLQSCLRCGAVVGDLPPHEAFALGGTNSVRGYEEGSVGTGRRFASNTAELHIPIKPPVEAAVFGDIATDFGSGMEVPGDPAGKRGKPGSGYGYGVGIRFDSPVGPLRLEYALNDSGTGRFHFGVGRDSA